jgi:hypothetical protein
MKVACYHSKYMADAILSNQYIYTLYTLLRGIKQEFRIEENQWVFRGLIKFIDISNADAQTRLLLHSLIDMHIL